jgi:hypothetical protein
MFGRRGLALMLEVVSVISGRLDIVGLRQEEKGEIEILWEKMFKVPVNVVQFKHLQCE